ncbi:hypothetical protein Ciccas_010663 [Cichlidogyrus casuarinus]|uniref:EF-hand domain-containing protein n=1 Tax=Cichlidogyrus casuarinus TaxID=1844966 RepID=A0ABD2PUC3_9PLAT
MSKQIELHPLVKAFQAIDKDKSWTITPLELKAYAHENNLEDDEMFKWLVLFDRDNDHRITFKEYCDALGLDHIEPDNKIVAEEASTLKSKPLPTRTAEPKGPSANNKQKMSRLPNDVELITSSMDEEDQIKITEKVRELTKPDSQGRVDERTLAHKLKQYLDESYGRMWHVVVLTGSYWMNYSHEPKYSFQFRLDRYVYLIWRTPAS